MCWAMDRLDSCDNNRDKTVLIENQLDSCDDDIDKTVLIENQ